MLPDVDVYYIPEGDIIIIECSVSDTFSDNSVFTVGIKKQEDNLQRHVSYIEFSKHTNKIIDTFGDVHVEFTENSRFTFTFNATTGNGGSYFCYCLERLEYASSNIREVVIQSRLLVFIVYILNSAVVILNISQT